MPLARLPTYVEIRLNLFRQTLPKKGIEPLSIGPKPTILPLDDLSNFLNLKNFGTLHESFTEFLCKTNVQDSLSYFYNKLKQNFILKINSVFIFS